MFSEKIDQLILVLEKQELEAPNGIVSAQLYAELFAAYLYKEDICNARFLWKRIPMTIKQSNVELDKIWCVFNDLWNNDVSSFFKSVKYEWSSSVAELMLEIKEKIYQKTINLIALAYSSIFEDNLCKMIDQTPEELTESCKTLGWEIQDGPFPRLIKPQKQIARDTMISSSEDQLGILTDFVSFLEN